MKCQKCGELVLGDSKFCDVCGQRLVSEKECSCGYICEQQFQFCPRCGKNFETGKTLYEIDIEKEKKKNKILSWCKCYARIFNEKWDKLK